MYFFGMCLILYFIMFNFLSSGDIKKVLKCVSDAADSYCCSDLIEKCIRGHGSWNLLPVQVDLSRGLMLMFCIASE